MRGKLEGKLSGRCYIVNETDHVNTMYMYVAFTFNTCTCVDLLTAGSSPMILRSLKSTNTFKNLSVGTLGPVDVSGGLVRSRGWLSSLVFSGDDVLSEK